MHSCQWMSGICVLYVAQGDAHAQSLCQCIDMVATTVAAPRSHPGSFCCQMLPRMPCESTSLGFKG